MSSPIHHAVAWGHYNAVKILLEHGANPNAINSYYGTTALHLSIRHTYICALLIEYGANIETKTVQRLAPIHLAIVYNTDIIDMVATPNVINDKSCIGTPLQIADNIGETEVMKKLIELGADASSIEHIRSPPRGVNLVLEPAMCEAMICNAKDIASLYSTIAPLWRFFNTTREIQLLINRSANINMKVKDHGRLLDVMCDIGNIEAVKLLLANGAIIDGYFPLITSIRSGNIGVVELLMEVYKDVHKYTEPGKDTLLHIATRHARVNVARLLIDKGLDVNALNNDNNAPIIAAILSASVDMVRLLIGVGADLTVKNVNGYMPLEIAYWNGNKEICELIRTQLNGGL